MKRVLSLVLALVLVLGMIPTFAADATGAQNLYDNGFITGKDGATVDAKLDVNAKLTRAQLAALIAELNGAKEEAAAFAQPADFTDAAMFQDWAKPYIAYAQENGWMTGYPDGSFQADKEVPANQLAAVLLNALGYTFEYSNVLATAAELGIVVDGTALTRGEAFEAMWTAVSAVNVNGEEMTLGVKLGKLEPATPVVTELAVTSVMADNLKTMVVEFNKAVDGDTITATTVKAVKGSSTDVVANRILSEDGKTLTIVYTTAAVAQSTDVKLTIDGVKSLDGTEKISAYTATKTVTDVAIPVIKGAAALNAKQIEVYFSEPMNTESLSAVSFQVINDVKIGDVAVIAKVTPNFATNSAVFELSTVLAAKTHTIKLANLVDYAGYKALATSFDVTVVEDKAAPQIASAVVKNINTIEVTFNEALSQQGSFYLNGGSVAVTATPVANSNNTKFTLTGFTLDLSAIVQIKVEYINQKDVVGNTVATKTAFVFNVADDTVLPTATVAVGTANKLTITFSKPMLTTVGTIQVLDKDKAAFGTALNVSALTFKSGSNNTVLELTGTQVGLGSVNAGTYYVKIKDMKDATVRANLLPEQVLEIAAVDSKAPTTTAFYTTKAGTLTGADLKKDDTITFYFSEAMDEATLKNLSNFVRNSDGLAFSAISGVSFKSVASDAKAVTFTYPAARDLAVGAKFTVYALKDLAGNMVTTNNNIDLLNNALTAPTSATLTATDKVQMTFNNVISSIDPSFITVNDGSGAYAVPVSATIGGSGVNAGKVVTFTLNKALDTFTTGYSVVQNNVTLVTDVYGQSLASNVTFTLANANFVDNVKPTLVSVKQVTTGSPAVNVPNQFVLKFSEAVTSTILDDLANDLVVRYPDGSLVAYTTGYTLSNITATPSTDLVVTLLPNANLENGTKQVTVQLAAERYLRDANSNFVAPFAAQSVDVAIDAVGPAISSIAFNGTTVITVTFTEAVVDATVTGADFTVGGTSVPGTFTVATGATANDNIYVITLNADPTIASGETVTVKLSGAGVVADATGNVSSDVTLFTYTHP